MKSDFIEPIIPPLNLIICQNRLNLSSARSSFMVIVDSEKIHQKSNLKKKEKFLNSEKKYKTIIR